MNNHLIDLYKFNISQAISDYFLHSAASFILKDFSDSFVNRLAIDSFNSKAEFRNLFSFSPAWNVYLQALVINGFRTHNPDFKIIDDLAHNILLNTIKYSIAPYAYAPNKKKSRTFKAICNALGVSEDSAGSSF